MLRLVRTTLSLDDDVAIELQRLQRKRREAFKQTVNAVLRAGLTMLAGRGRDRQTPPVRTVPASLGTPRLKDLDNISEVLAFAEGEDHR
jgi:hypothetical protein